jgi:hypothetical protein
MTSHVEYVLGCIALVAASACSSAGGASGSYGGTNAGPADTGVASAVGNATPIWTGLYADVIGKQCVVCHNPSGIGVMLGQLDMSSQAIAYTNLVNAPAAGEACAGHGVRVTPDDPDASILYLKVSLDSPSCGARMPFGGPPLPETQVNEIRDWILAGAPND